MRKKEQAAIDRKTFVMSTAHEKPSFVIDYDRERETARKRRRSSSGEKQMLAHVFAY